MRIKQTFFAPAVTAQFAICPVPFQMDTYKGCVYDCTYCFARDLTNFHRRRSGARFNRHLQANDPAKLATWLAKNLGRPDDPSKASRVALNMRIPLKIGVIADPCPPLEASYRVTEKCLRVLHARDYPVQVQTKNPGVLAKMLERLGPDHNLCVSVTLTSVDEDWAAKVEPNAPPPSERLREMKRIAAMGYPVYARVQPAVYPFVLDQLPLMVPLLAEAGVWAFNTEGLKYRIAMGKAEAAMWEKGPLAGTRERYRSRGRKDGADWVLTDQMKEDYIGLAEELARKHGLGYYSADNSPLGRGDGYECCGTVKLRGHTPFRYNLRTRAFGVMDPDDRLAACVKNFTRSTSNSGPHVTVKEDVDEMIARKRG